MASAEFHEAVVYALSCVGRQNVTLTVKPKQEEALVVLLISLRFEQREYLREGVERAFISLSPRKPTGCKPHVSGLNCRGFVWRSATDRSFTHARKNFTRVRSEAKSTVVVHL